MPKPKAAVSVAYVTQDDLATHSGYAGRVGYIASRMREMGADVRVIGSARARAAVLDAELVGGSGVFGKLRTWLRAIGLVARRKVTHLAFTSIGAPYNAYFAFAARLLGATVVYDAHDPVVELLPEIYGRSPLIRAAVAYVALLERWIGAIAHVTLAAGPSQLRAMRARGFYGTLLPVYNVQGLALDGHPDGLREHLGWQNATIVVYVGGLQRHMRGIEQQIDAVALARKNGSDVRFLIVGFGADLEYFRDLAKPLIAANAAKLFVNLPHAKVTDMLQSCDLAFSSEPLKYGMQSKMLEYLNSGVRLITIGDDRDLNVLFGTVLGTYDGTTSDMAAQMSSSAGRLHADERERIAQILQEMRETSERSIAASVRPTG